MSEQHALFSPSSAERWVSCPGSLAMSVGIPRRDNKFGAEGTAAHEVAARCLTYKKPAKFFVGEKITIGKFTFDVTADMAGHVQKYVDKVWEYAAGNSLLIEAKVDFSEYIGVTGQWGTADALIFLPDEVQVHDLKFGMGVKVDAKENKQLMTYGLGVWAMYHGVQEKFDRFRFVIHQPRIKNFSEWDCDLDRLMQHAKEISKAALTANEFLARRKSTLTAADLHPSEKACKFCPAKTICPALAGQALSVLEMVDLFTALPTSYNPETKGVWNR